MGIIKQVCRRNIPVVFYLLLCLSPKAAEYNPDLYKYKIATAGLGTQDNMLYKVTCWVKNPSYAIATASVNAIHGVIFSGCDASAEMPEQSPLIKTPTLSKEQSSYFDAFFRDKKYNQYIVSVAQSSMKVIKMKKQYQIEIVVSVNKRKLRQELEKAGIIKRLGAAFEK